MIRLRQVALVASEVEAVESELCEAVGVSGGGRDAGEGEVGVH